MQQLTAIKGDCSFSACASRLIAGAESSAGLGESERKRIAAKAVNDLMRRL